MPKEIELVGGPTPGWRVLPDEVTEHVVYQPNMERIHKEAETAKPEDAVPVRAGRYQPRYTGSRVFDWKGWDE